MTSEKSKREKDIVKVRWLANHADDIAVFGFTLTQTNDKTKQEIGEELMRISRETDDQFERLNHL